MRVRAAGVCHTRPHARRGRWPVKTHARRSSPATKAVGEVAALGRGSTFLKEGERDRRAPGLHIRLQATLRTLRRRLGNACEKASNETANRRWRLCPNIGSPWRRETTSAASPTAPTLARPALGCRAGVTVLQGLKEAEAKPGRLGSPSRHRRPGTCGAKRQRRWAFTSWPRLHQDKPDLATGCAASDLSSRHQDPWRAAIADGGVRGVRHLAVRTPAFAQAAHAAPCASCRSSACRQAFPLPSSRSCLKRIKSVPRLQSSAPATTCARRWPFAGRGQKAATPFQAGTGWTKHQRDLRKMRAGQIRRRHRMEI